MRQRRRPTTQTRAVELRHESRLAVQEIFKDIEKERPAIEERLHEAEIQLVQNLYLSASRSPFSTVFAGVDHQVGATRVCARTALALAQFVDAEVCVVDANVRTPCLAQFFGVQNTAGFVDFITDNTPLEEFSQPHDFVQRLGRSNLHVMTTGSALSVPTLPLNRINYMYERILALRSAFDYVLMDCAPVNAYPDSALIAPATDGVVLVVQANKTRRAAFGGAVDRLTAASATVLGTVLSQREYPIPEAIYRKL